MRSVFTKVRHKCISSHPSLSFSFPEMAYFFPFTVPIESTRNRTYLATRFIPPSRFTVAIHCPTFISLCLSRYRRKGRLPEWISHPLVNYSFLQRRSGSAVHTLTQLRIDNGQCRRKKHHHHKAKKKRSRAAAIASRFYARKRK